MHAQYKHGRPKLLMEKYNHSVFVEYKIKIKQYPLPLQSEHALDMLEDKLLFLQAERRQ
jgi:hypothetical protein